MTSFFQSISRSPFAVAGSCAAFTGTSPDTDKSEVEYQLVFATTAAALIAAGAVVFAALAHTL